MTTYTHVTRTKIGTNPDGTAVWKEVETPDVTAFETNEELVAAMTDPYWSEIVEMTLSQHSTKHKTEIKCTRLCKAVNGQKGLWLNADAKEGAIEPMKWLAAELGKTTPGSERYTLLLSLMSQGVKAILAFAKKEMAAK